MKVDSFSVNKWIWREKKTQRTKNWLGAHEHDWKEIPRNRQAKETRPENDTHTHTHTQQREKTRSTVVCFVWLAQQMKWKRQHRQHSYRVWFLLVSFLYDDHSCMCACYDRFRCVWANKHKQEHTGMVCPFLVILNRCIYCKELRRIFILFSSLIFMIWTFDHRCGFLHKSRDFKRSWLESGFQFNTSMHSSFKEMKRKKATMKAISHHRIKF